MSDLAATFKTFVEALKGNVPNKIISEGSNVLDKLALKLVGVRQTEEMATNIGGRVWDIFLFLIRCETTTDVLKVACVRLIFRLLKIFLLASDKISADSVWEVRLPQIISHVLSNCEVVLAVCVQEFVLPFDDLRLRFLQTLHGHVESIETDPNEIMAPSSKRQRLEENASPKEELSVDQIVRVLRLLPVPNHRVGEKPTPVVAPRPLRTVGFNPSTKDEEEDEDDFGGEFDDEDLPALTTNEKPKIRKFELFVVTSKFKGVEEFDDLYASAFQSAWLHFLNNSKFSTSIDSRDFVADLLRFVITNVCPFLSFPLGLAGTFNNLFDRCDTNELQNVKIAALEGLFYLLTQCRMMEEDVEESGDGISSGFYSRLLQLVTPSIFTGPGRERFVDILVASLQSPFLPKNFAIAFIKRLAQVGCCVPPNVTIWIIGILSVLLKAHRTSCQPLTHIPPALALLLEIPNGSHGTDENLMCRVVPTEFGVEAEDWRRFCAATGISTNPKELEAIVDTARRSLWEIGLWNKSISSEVKQCASVFSVEKRSGAAAVSQQVDMSLLAFRDVKNLLKRSYVRGVESPQSLTDDVGDLLLLAGKGW